MLIVKVFGDWSVSTPPLRMPPSSRTWKVKVGEVPAVPAAGLEGEIAVVELGER